MFDVTANNFGNTVIPHFCRNGKYSGDILHFATGVIYTRVIYKAVSFFVRMNGETGRLRAECLCSKSTIEKIETQKKNPI